MRSFELPAEADSVPAEIGNDTKVVTMRSGAERLSANSSPDDLWELADGAHKAAQALVRSVIRSHGSEPIKLLDEKTLAAEYHALPPLPTETHDAVRTALDEGLTDIANSIGGVSIITAEGMLPFVDEPDSSVATFEVHNFNEVFPTHTMHI